MKNLTNVFIAVLFCCFSFSTFAQFGDPVQRTVCEIVTLPVDELDVITAGTVTDLVGNDKFEITSDGCSILCDGGTGYLPIPGMFVAVEGRVQEEDLFEDLTIDVRSWIPYGEDPPEDPEPIVFFVEDAIDAEVGTPALLFGFVQNYSDEDEGIGTFIDGTGSMFIDFPDGDSPDEQQNVYVLGIVEENNAENPVLDVIYWYPEGGEPPPPPPAIAWSIDEANTLPLGSFCLIMGSTTSWIDKPNGIGVFDDNENTMGIDFEVGVELPFLYNTVFAFGQTAENTDNERVIEAHAYLDIYSQPLITICDVVNTPVNEMPVITQGTVTQLVDNDKFMLSSEGCSVLCDGEINELPWIGNIILIEGVVEYEELGNDLEIDTDNWYLIDEGGLPDEDPPPAVFTVEDAISSPVGTIALLSGEVTEFMDEVTGLASFTDATGSMNMDFAGDNLPQVDNLIHVLGVVEYGDGAPSQIDVFHWYYEGGEPPPEEEPIGWNIGELDSLPGGTYCLVYGAVTSWIDENAGEGVFDDGSNSINIDFAAEVEELPALNDSVFVLGILIEYYGIREIKAYYFFDYITLYAPTLISICEIVDDPLNGLPVITIGKVKEIVDDDEFILRADGCQVLCEGDVNALPELEAYILIAGVVEVDDSRDILSVDIEYWAEYGSDPSPTPVGIAVTVEEALNADEGEWVILSGTIEEYSNLNEGKGDFVDATGTITMDFRADAPPVPDALIHVLGVVEDVNGTNEINAAYWYYEGGEPPPDPPDIASSVEEIGTLPLNTYCFIFGEITSWIDESAGVGIFDDGNSNITVDFENDVVVLPEPGQPFFVLGLTGEGPDRGVEIKAHYWIGEDMVGVDDPLDLTQRIQVYPNPAKTILYVDSEEPISRILVYSIKGELVKEVIQFENSAINVSDLKSGMYVISLFNDNGYLVSKKLVIE